MIYNLVINTIAWSAIVWCTIMFLICIVIYFKSIDKLQALWSIKKEFFISKNDIIYLIPTIGFNFYTNNELSCEIIIYWLKYQLYIYYDIDKNES